MLMPNIVDGSGLRSELSTLRGKITDGSGIPSRKFCTWKQQPAGKRAHSGARRSPAGLEIRDFPHKAHIVVTVVVAEDENHVAGLLVVILSYSGCLFWGGTGYRCPDGRQQGQCRCKGS